MKRIMRHKIVIIVSFICIISVIISVKTIISIIKNRDNIVSLNTQKHKEVSIRFPANINEVGFVIEGKKYNDIRASYTANKNILFPINKICAYYNIKMTYYPQDDIIKIYDNQNELTLTKNKTEFKIQDKVYDLSVPILEKNGNIYVSEEIVAKLNGIKYIFEPESNELFLYQENTDAIKYISRMIYKKGDKILVEDKKNNKILLNLIIKDSVPEVIKMGDKKGFILRSSNSIYWFTNSEKRIHSLKISPDVELKVTDDGRYIYFSENQGSGIKIYDLEKGKYVSVLGKGEYNTLNRLMYFCAFEGRVLTCWLKPESNEMEYILEKNGEIQYTGIAKHIRNSNYYLVRKNNKWYILNSRLEEIDIGYFDDAQCISDKVIVASNQNSIIIGNDGKIKAEFNEKLTVLGINKQGDMYYLNGEKIYSFFDGKENFITDINFPISYIIQNDRSDPLLLFSLTDKVAYAYDIGGSIKDIKPVSFPGGEIPDKKDDWMGSPDGKYNYYLSWEGTSPIIQILTHMGNLDRYKLPMLAKGKEKTEWIKWIGDKLGAVYDDKIVLLDPVNRHHLNIWDLDGKIEVLEIL